MKTLKFTRGLDAWQHITVTIKDEEQFRQFCKEWVEQGQTFNFWNIEEMDDSIVSVRYNDIEWEDGNCDDFYELMKQAKFPVDEDDLEEEEQEK